MRHQRAADRDHLLLAARQGAGELLAAAPRRAETNVKTRARSSSNSGPRRRV